MQILVSEEPGQRFPVLGKSEPEKVHVLGEELDVEILVGPKGCADTSVRQFVGRMLFVHGVKHQNPLQW